jgi:transposase
VRRNKLSPSKVHAEGSNLAGLEEAQGIRLLEQFADTLEQHQDGILNYYEYAISTGPLEGTNTKIQLMKRQAYGYRDHAFFKLKILGLHETKYALVG